jgi:Nif-specific regulatory protein
MTRTAFSHKQLDALHAVALVLAKPGELDDALRKTLKKLAKHLNMKRGMISVFRRDLEEIHTVVAIGMSSSQSDQARYNLGEGITGRVVQTGRPIAVPCLDNEPLFLDRSGTRRNLNRSDLAFICVPIRFGDEVVGALSSDVEPEGTSDLTTELKLLQSVADLIASRVERRRMIEENKRLRDIAGGVDPQGLIIGSSRAIRNVRYLLSQVADSRTTVLLTGENGTGKGLVARALHNMSPRSTQPFVHVNCGAIPEHLIESELFGHEKGAFTDATKNRSGRFESAGSGTIFLDEINTLPAQAQVKLLKVLQDKEYERVGSSRPIRTNARIITATNGDLEKEVEAKKFRADLFYRLNVFPIFIPPLRERGADIMMLADHFVKTYSEELGKTVTRIDTPAIDMLMSYHWPGNVRELENAIERSVLLANEGVITSQILPPSLQMKTMESRTEKRGKLEQLVASYEIGLIVDALKDGDGNQTKAAQLLGTTKRIIQYKIQKYKIDYTKFKRG